jgi:Rps23 Pro-64 3,4-dihydroxylase Tpa1-like proline 4-hydroxylase
MYFVPGEDDKSPEEREKEAKKTKKKKGEKARTPGPWTASDGGSLDLLNVDSNCQAAATARRIVPQFNSFAMFEVSARSFHQVAEVTSDKLRLTIGGWFHGAIPASSTAYVTPLPVELPLVASTGGGLDDWLHREYRKPKSVKQINKQFLEESSIELHNFLRSDVYEQLVKALEAASTSTPDQFEAVGPRNRCQYAVFPESKSANAPEALFLSRFRTFLLSTEFAGFITQCTGLSALKGACQIRRFRCGDYTLAHDLDQVTMLEESLEIYIQLSQCLSQTIS